MSQINIKHCSRYDLHYQLDGGPGYEQVILLRREMHDGYRLYRVKATYAKPVVACNYYVIARSETEARKIFKGTFSWLSIISEVNVVDDNTAQTILSSLRKYIVI